MLEGTKIVCLGSKDAESLSDSLKDLQQLVETAEIKYPNINKWFISKVTPGLKTGERGCYLLYNNEEPIASGIIKKGVDSKLCHLNIKEGYRNRKLGKLLFSLMVIDVINTTVPKSIYFTLPEGLWETRKSFFNSLGFLEAVKNNKQYRIGEKELKCSASIYTLRNHIWRFDV